MMANPQVTLAPSLLIDKTPANARYWEMFDHAVNEKRLTVEFMPEAAESDSLAGDAEGVSAGVIANARAHPAFGILRRSGMS